MKHVLLASLIVLAASILGIAQQPVASQGIEQRLAALSPSDPMAYFALAEEIAYEGESLSPSAQRRAIELLVLAFELDRNASEPQGMGQSVCLALAEVVSDPIQRRWLWSAARTFPAPAVDLPPGAVAPTLPPLPPEATDAANSGPTGLIGEAPDSQASISLALTAIRASDSRTLRTALIRLSSAGGNRGTVSKGISELERLLFAAEIPRRETVEICRAASAIVESPVCKTCRNKRILDDSSESGLPGASSGEGLRICPTCGGVPPNGLEDDTRRALLIAHTRILGIEARVDPTSWGSTLLARGEAPTSLLDPTDLAQAFGVDPERPYWSPSPTPADPLAGQWTTAPSSR